jgi:hypothetical protein
MSNSKKHAYNLLLLIPGRCSFIWTGISRRTWMLWTQTEQMRAELLAAESGDTPIRKRAELGNGFPCNLIHQRRDELSEMFTISAYGTFDDGHYTTQPHSMQQSTWLLVYFKHVQKRDRRNLIGGNYGFQKTPIVVCVGYFLCPLYCSVLSEAHLRNRSFVSTSQKTHCMHLRYKINWLILFREINIVYSENYSTYTLWAKCRVPLLLNVAVLNNNRYSLNG